MYALLFHLYCPTSLVQGTTTVLKYSLSDVASIAERWPRAGPALALGLARANWLSQVISYSFFIYRKSLTTQTRAKLIMALYLIFSFKLDSTKPEWDLFPHVQNVLKFTAFVIISCWNRKHTHTVRTHSIHSLVHTNWCKRLDSHPLHTRFAIQFPLHLIHHTSSSIISFVSVSNQSSGNPGKSLNPPLGSLSSMVSIIIWNYRRS